jgi:Family of unknown function (DUF6176)
MTLPMPPSVPPGMRLELSRARLLPGAQAETERWMGMLHVRYEECLDTLSAERMAFEATFRHTDADGTEWLYHLQLSGEDGGGLDLSNPVDAEHQAYAMRCKEPGWEELRPVLLPAPRPVPAAMRTWARDRGTSARKSPPDGAVGGGEQHGGGRRQVADGGEPVLLHRLRLAHHCSRLQPGDAAGDGGGDGGLQRREPQRRQRDAGREVGAPVGVADRRALRRAGAAPGGAGQGDELGVLGVQRRV